MPCSLHGAYALLQEYQTAFETLQREIKAYAKLCCTAVARRAPLARMLWLLLRLLCVTVLVVLTALRIAPRLLVFFFTFLLAFSCRYKLKVKKMREVRDADRAVHVARENASKTKISEVRASWWRQSHENMKNNGNWIVLPFVCARRRIAVATMQRCVGDASPVFWCSALRATTCFQILAPF